MKGRFFAFLLGFFGLLFIGVVNAHAAQNSPSFPTCNTPQGSVIASYGDGTHGIPGDSNTHNGADTVYSVNGNQVLQCFCGNGQGVQTNWWKVGDLSQSDISFWQSQGWVYIPDGSAWGLDATGYLSYNAPYSCSTNNNNSPSGNNGGGPNSGSGSTNTSSACNDTIPSYPPYVTSVISGQNSVTLNWSKAGDPVSSYLIIYGTQQGIYTFGIQNVGNVTTYTINGLANGQTYYFIVKGINGCQTSSNSNEVSNFIPRGLLTGGPATGLLTGVLGATTSPASESSVLSLTKAICSQCLWWPMLLGEIAALAALYVLLKRGSIKVNKYLLGVIVGLITYLLFIAFNKGHVCPDGGIGFWKLNIPCKYFWVLDGIIVILFSLITRRIITPVFKKPSKKR